MKLLKYFLVIYFLFSNQLNAQIIEFGNCYSVQNEKELVRTNWNLEHYKKLSVIYHKFLDQAEITNDNVWNLNSVDNLITDDNEIKDLLKDGYKVIKLFDKFIVSINLTNETISTLREYSSERQDITAISVSKYINLKNKFPDKWNKKNQRNLDWAKEFSKLETDIEKYKIEEYVGGIFIGRLIEDISTIF